MTTTRPEPERPRTRVLLGNLADFRRSDVALAGGKGANLGELVQAHFPVPPGFVVTTAAYERTLGESGLGSTLAAMFDAGAGGEALRAAVAAVQLPGALRRGITDAWRELGGGPVAVRSSATAEDLPGAAFAGQQDTFLNVTGEDALLTAVVACWASLWTDRAIEYRAQRNIRPQEVSIAVIVQSMIPADVAGVMFTADPVTGMRDRVVIDAAAGLGEAVVSGRVTPEHYVLDSRGRLRQWSPGGYETVIRAVAGGGTTESAAARGTGPLLTRRQLGRLAGIARKAAVRFGAPQDLEWAVAEGQVRLLQSRPMTALPPEPPRLHRVQKLIGPMLIEMFQSRPYPLDVSGWLAQGILPMLERLAGSLGARFPPVQAILPEEDGVVRSLVPPVPRPTPAVLAAPFSLAARARRFKLADWEADPRLAQYLDTIDTLNRADPAGLGWQPLLAQARAACQSLRPMIDVRLDYLPGMAAAQVKLRLILLLLGKRRLAPALIAGAETHTSQANRELDRLAVRVRADAGLRALFERLDGAELLHGVTAAPGQSEFRQALQRFLRDYGHRETVSVTLSSSPTWAESPAIVLDMVKVLTSDQGRTADQTGDALRELIADPRLRHGRVQPRVLKAVHAARAGIAFREDTHFQMTRALPPLRRALLEAGERLRRAGVLDRADDVFHLRFEELAAIPDAGTMSAAERDRLRATVAARAAKRRELAGVPMLDLDVLFADRVPDEQALVTGTGASRGVATGPVRVIRGPAEFGTLRPGDVLVCPYTNPAWTPLFQRAAAVVVDAGGPASHAAIVAREYGIPAVMGTRNGTTVLAGRGPVTVDGTAGCVRTAAERD